MRKSYNKVHRSAVAIQVGLRAMAARNEYRHKRRTKAATAIQVCILMEISGTAVPRLLCCLNYMAVIFLIFYAQLQ